MTCEHLKDLEHELTARGFTGTFRGRVWSANAREWVYFNVCFDMPAVRAMFNFASCVVDHFHAGIFDGQEAGFECTEHKDAVRGVHPEFSRGVPVFP